MCYSFAIGDVFCRADNVVVVVVVVVIVIAIAMSKEINIMGVILVSLIGNMLAYTVETLLYIIIPHTGVIRRN